MDPVLCATWNSAEALSGFKFNLVGRDATKTVINISREELKRLRALKVAWEIPEMPRVKPMPKTIFPFKAFYTVIYSQDLQAVYPPPKDFKFLNFGMNLESKCHLETRVFLGERDSVEQWRTFMFVYEIHNYKPDYDRDRILKKISHKPLKISVTIDNFYGELFLRTLEVNKIKSSEKHLEEYPNMMEINLTLNNKDQISYLDNISECGVVASINYFDTDDIHPCS